MSNSSRMPKELYYLGIAEAVSKRSSCLNKQYGAVIVKNDSVISTGYNGSARGLPNCCELGYCYRIEHNIERGTMYETCLASSVKIMLPNGRKEAMGSIYKFQSGVDRMYYAMDPDTKHFSQVKGTVIESGVRNRMYCIEFETGQKIHCTPEHRFLSDDRITYVEAQTLKALDRIAGVRWQYDPFREGREWLIDHTVTISDVYEVILSRPEPVYDLIVPQYANFVISIGDDGSNIGIVSHNCNAVHAEQNAIISAKRSDMLHSTMYLYGYDLTQRRLVENPNCCTLCRRMIVNAGIDQVVFADENGIRKTDHPTNSYGYLVRNVNDWIAEYDPDNRGY